MKNVEKNAIQYLQQLLFFIYSVKYIQTEIPGTGKNNVGLVRKEETEDDLSVFVCQHVVCSFALSDGSNDHKLSMVI